MVLSSLQNVNTFDDTSPPAVIGSSTSCRLPFSRASSYDNRHAVNTEQHTRSTEQYLYRGLYTTANSVSFSVEYQKRTSKRAKSAAKRLIKQAKAPEEAAATDAFTCIIET